MVGHTMPQQREISPAQISQVLSRYVITVANRATTDIIAIEIRTSDLKSPKYYLEYTPPLPVSDKQLASSS